MYIHNSLVVKGYTDNLAGSQGPLYLSIVCMGPSSLT